MCIGRSEVNYHDMIVAMGDMNVTVGDLHEWHTISDQVPFAKRQSPGIAIHCMIDGYISLYIVLYGVVYCIAIPRFPLTKPVLLVEPDTPDDVNGASANGSNGNGASLPTDASSGDDEKKANTITSSTTTATSAAGGSTAVVRMKKTSTHPHIPPFLPDFPDRRTYIHTPVCHIRIHHSSSLLVIVRSWPLLLLNFVFCYAMLCYVIGVFRT